MKMKAPHAVRLSTQAMTLLQSLHNLAGHSPLLFPVERDHQKPMGNNTMRSTCSREPR